MLDSDLSIEENAVWIMYSAEGSDRYFSKFITDKTVVPTTAILSNDESILLVHELDKENVSDFNGKIIVYDSKFTLIKSILGVLENMKCPQKIYLNFSDRLDAQTDVLGHGTFRFLSDNINKFYLQNGKSAPKFVSADELLYFLLDTKTEEDIKYLSIAANRALEILSLTFKKIKTGMTEKQIANLVHHIFKIKPRYFKNYGIIKEELSWEKATCPIVLTGANLKKGGHTAPSEKKFMPGETIYFDFGIKITLKNGKSYSSDLQRMGYALKHGEVTPPVEIQKIFETLVNAIDLGIKSIEPGMPGHDVDKIVRDYIISNGYPDYNHATGHPIGENAHNPGTSISPKGYKRSSMPVRKNGVYTIEPRIQIENGGSIEEMVKVTENGAAPLCAPQKSLYIIK